MDDTASKSIRIGSPCSGLPGHGEGGVALAELRAFGGEMQQHDPGLLRAQTVVIVDVVAWGGKEATRMQTRRGLGARSTS
jgi:hypothetical protein